MSARLPLWPRSLALLASLGALLASLGAPAIAFAAPTSTPAVQRTALLPTERLNITEPEGRRLRRALRQTLAKRPQLRLLDDGTVAAALLRQPAGCGKHPACLRKLAKALRATRLLAFRAGQLGETTMLRLTLYDEAGVKKGSWQEVLRSRGPAPGGERKRERDDATLREALARMVDGLALRPITVAAPEPTPWYGRWWVWTVVGVAVAGAVTTTVILTRDTRPEADYIIRL